MARKIPKAQNAGHHLPEEQRTLTKMLLAHPGHRTGCFRTDEIFDWMLEDILRDIGLNIWKEPPEETKNAVRELSEAYAKAVTVSEPFADILGNVYMSVGQGNSHMGQYFTPEPVARMIAKMSLGDDDPLGRDTLLTICEPSAGSGVMLTSMVAEIMSRFGRDALGNIGLTAVDLDRTCAMMTAVQLMGNAVIHGLSYGEVLVVHGDSLFPWKIWYPILHASRPDLVLGRDVPHPHHPDRKEAIARAAKGQQSMFPWADSEAQKNVV